MLFGGPSADGLSKVTITVNQLKHTIVAEWGKLLQHLVYRAIGHWRRRFECVVQQRGGHIEHLMRKLQNVTVALDNN